MTTVAARDLTVEYESGGYVVRPIDGLSFEIPTGSLALLLGPSGCGKSTLLSCLAGILTPTSGALLVDGRDVSGLAGRDLTAYRRGTVGIVFQAFNLVPSLSATENVAAPLLASGVRRREAAARADRLLAAVDLGDRARHRPAELSGGQQQRVAVARALAHDPPLLLADEPTAHLDYIQVEGVLRLLRELAVPGRSVVVATHDERMLPLADIVIELSPRFADGAAGGPPEERVLAAGEVVFTQGSRGGRIYIVDEGEIEIVRVAAGGAETMLAVVGAGDHFGEMGPLFDLPRSATARARTAARITGYTVRQFGELVGLDRLGGLVAERNR